MTLVVPAAVSRNRVLIVGLKGRPELNGKVGTIGAFNEAKARFPVHLGPGEWVLIKMMNLISVLPAARARRGAASSQLRLQPALDPKRHAEQRRDAIARAASVAARREWYVQRTKVNIEDAPGAWGGGWAAE